MEKKATQAASILLLAALLLAAGQFFALETVPETVVAQEEGISGVPAQTLNGLTVSAEGLVEPLTFVNLSFQTGGVITEILVEESDRVNAGDVLIRLDDQDLALALAQAQARQASVVAGLVAAQNELRLAAAGITTAESQVTAAEANLALTEAGPRPEEIAAAEANIAAAESTLAQAVGNRGVALDVTSEAEIYAAEADVAQAYSELRRLEEEYQMILDTCFEVPDGGEICPLYGPVEESTREQLEAARVRYQAALRGLEATKQGPTAAQQRAASGGVSVAEANLNTAEAHLAVLMAGATAEEIAIAEIGVRQAEAGVELARAQVAIAEAAVQRAESAVVQAQTNIASIQAALDRMILRAPYEAEVSRVDASVGQVVNSGAPVLMMADFGGWLVKTTDLTELEVSSVSESASVEVRLDAIPDEIIVGRVTKIALVADSSLGDVAYVTEIMMENALDLPIRWGMTAFVEIEANE